jgi:hypothetical protein
MARNQLLALSRKVPNDSNVMDVLTIGLLSVCFPVP